MCDVSHAFVTMSEPIHSLPSIAAIAVKAHDLYLTTLSIFLTQTGVFPAGSVAYDGEWHHVAVVLGPGPTLSSPAYLAVYWDGERVGTAQTTPLDNIAGCDGNTSCPADFVRVGGTRVTPVAAGNFTGTIRDVLYFAGGLLETDAIALGGGSTQRVGALTPACQCPLTHPVWVGTPYLQSCRAHFPSTSGEVVDRVVLGGGARFYPGFVTDGNVSTQWRSGPNETSAEVYVIRLIVTLFLPQASTTTKILM